jgi:hypothetical protein
MQFLFMFKWRSQLKPVAYNTVEWAVDTLEKMMRRKQQSQQHEP